MSPHTLHAAPDPLTRVLQGLRDTEPAPGLESRLLQTLAAHQQQHPIPLTITQRLRRLAITSSPRRWLLPSASLTAAALVLVAILGLLHHSRPAVQSTGAPRSGKAAGSLSARASNPPSTAGPTRPSALPSHRNPQFASVHPAATSIPSIVAPSSATANHHNSPPTAPPQTTPDEPATLALAETTAPSHPAPPMPLTTEERAFQRFVSRHNAVALAALSPLNQPAHEAAAQQDFNAFFPPPPPPETLNPPTAQPTKPPTPTN